MMAGRFMIDGIWCDVPEGENLNDWLNENVSVIIDPNTCAKAAVGGEFREQRL